MDRLRRRESGFFFASNEAARDRRLSAEARGLLFYLLTHSDGFPIRAVVTQKVMRVGKDRLQRMVKELEATGYLLRERRKDTSGKFRGYDWHTEDVPGCFENRMPENPAAGKGSTIRKKKRENEQKGKTPNSPQGADVFEEFVEAYPTTDHAPNMAKVAELFERTISGQREELDESPTADQLIRAARAFAETNTATDPRFIPSPMTWLRKARWLDFEEVGE